MKKIFLKYNPYRLKTEITNNGHAPAQDSELVRRFENARLQDWIEYLPEGLRKEYNDDKFDIEFHGTKIDYDDLVEICELAKEKGNLDASPKHIPGKEAEDKEPLIESIFEDIQKCRFDEFSELKAPEVIAAFNAAKSQDFEVCVVATMSAGKSTLINAFLAENLMPSRREACTAVITKIKDTDKNGWKAYVYDSDGNFIKEKDDLMPKDVESLNDRQMTSKIEIYGNIPFVQAEDVSLVLVDTPGANNSCNLDHAKIQEEYLNKSSKSLVLYVMSYYQSGDNTNLLQKVVECMTAQGKQSKDRFIFVLNKMDENCDSDGKTDLFLERIREYLINHGIENPNLFPVAALPALNIRLMERGVIDDENISDQTETTVKKLNRTENLHLENFANLPKSVKDEIKEELENAKEKDPSNENKKTALIHTGIPSLEAAIRQYVQKYAKTQKIRDIVDTFEHKLNELHYMEKIKEEVSNNEEKRNLILAQISDIKKKMNDGKSAKAFLESVDASLDMVSNNVRDKVAEIEKRYQDKLTPVMDKLRTQPKIEKSVAETECRSLQNLAKELEPQFRSDLEEMLNESFANACHELLENYKMKLATLAGEIETGSIPDKKIDLKQLLSGDMPSSFDIEVLKAKDVRVRVGERTIKNERKKWYKPWTWFEDAEYQIIEQAWEKHVSADEINQQLIVPITSQIFEHGKLAEDEANAEANEIAKEYKEQARKLDDILEKKLKELEQFAQDKDNADQQLEESRERLNWLKNIQNKIDSILEI